MDTFHLPTYTTLEVPLNTLPTSHCEFGQIGQNAYIFDCQVRNGLRRLFNNSRYLIEMVRQLMIVVGELECLNILNEI
jgi:hypothetical protein